MPLVDELEKQRGISVTTSVMQFPFNEQIINLLDTPGHADFTEDTYRTLTAVDSADGNRAAKGVEARTIKLMEVCRLRTTPIMTFINKMDRETRDPIELLDEIERILDIQCAPVTWPIGSGKAFKGIYHLREDCVYLYESNDNASINHVQKIQGIDNPECESLNIMDEFRDELELVRGASHKFDRALSRGKQAPFLWISYQ